MADLDAKISETISILGSLSNVLSQPTITGGATGSIADTTKQVEATIEIFKQWRQINSCGQLIDEDLCEHIAALTYCMTLELSGFRDRLEKCALSGQDPLTTSKSIEKDTKNLKFYLRGQLLNFKTTFQTWQGEVQPPRRGSSAETPGSKAVQKVSDFVSAQSKGEVLLASDTLQPVSSQTPGHTFGNIDVHDYASVQLGDTYQQVSLHFNHGTTEQHEAITSKLHRQTQVITGINASLSPMVQESNETHSAVNYIANATQRQAATLVDIKDAITRLPSDTAEEKLFFIDALDRRFRLPFNWFGNWQTFQGFLSHMFPNDKVPGGSHVECGSFIINDRTHQNTFLQESNWNMLVFPGNTLTMYIIMRMAKLTLRSCPRPGCDRVTENVYQEGRLVTCWDCRLEYRFDPKIQMLAPKEITEERIIEAKQAHKDRDYYGQRRKPRDIEIRDYRETKSVETSQGALPSLTKAIKAHYGSTLKSEHTSDDENHKVNIFPPGVEPVSDQGNGRSALEEWLATSVMHEVGEPPELDNDYELAKEWREREMEDLKKLKRVLFMATEVPTEPLRKIVKDYSTMTVEAQIYTRKILDKFPSLPTGLASKLAKSNVERKDRLPGLR